MSASDPSAPGLPLAGGGGASLPTTPGLALLDAGAASRVVVLNVSGVGDTEAYDTVGITALSEILGGESDGDFVVGDGAGAVQLASEAPAAVRAIIGAAAIPTAGVDASRPTPSVATLGALYTSTDTGVRYVCESDGSGGARWAVQGARGQEGRDTTAVLLDGAYGDTSVSVDGSTMLSYAVVFAQRSIPTTAGVLLTINLSDGVNGTYLDIGRDSGDRYLLGVYRYGFSSPATALTGATISGSPTTTHCIAVTYDGATVRYSLDGAAAATVSSGTGAALVGTAPLRLGKAGAAGTTAVDAWLTSAVAWSTAVSDADLAIVSGAARAAGSTPGRIPRVSGATEIARWHAASMRTNTTVDGAVGTLGGVLTWTAAPTLVIR